MTAVELATEIFEAGFDLVANDDGRLLVRGKGAFPEHLAAALLAQKRAVMALMDATCCRRHGRDYRAFCGLPACVADFPDDLPMDAVDHRTGRLRS